MGQLNTKHIKCFNELNTRFYHRDSNYFCPLHECKSGLDASWIREFPKGCYNYFCENCYYEHYHQNDKPFDTKPDLYESERHPRSEDDVDLQPIENLAYTSKMPKPEWDRDMDNGPWPEQLRLKHPEWSEILTGVELV